MQAQTTIPEFVGCCVKVVTREHLPIFASEAKELADAIRKELQEEERKVFPSAALA